MSKSKRRTKPAKATPQAQTPIPEALADVIDAPVTYERDEPFCDVEDFEVDRASERALLALMQDWRKGRATRTIWDMIVDGYVAVFSSVIIIAMVVSGLLGVQHSAAGCDDLGCRTSRELLPWLALSALTLAAVSAARLFGPVIASAAEGFWLLEAPIRRTIILSKRLRQVLILTFVITGLGAWLVLVPTGMTMISTIIWALAVGLAGASVTALCAIAQARENYFAVKIAQFALAIASFGVLLLMVGVNLGWWHITTDLQVIHTRGIYAAVITAITLVITAAIAFGQLNRIRRARLVSGGDLVSGMQGAMFALDFGLMRDILVERRWYNRGHVTPSPGRGVGAAPLIWRDIERLKRNPRHLLVVLASIVVPYALLAMGLNNLAWPLSAIVLMFVMIPLFDALRVVNRTKGLSRCFPLSRKQLNTALTIVPGVLALFWALAVMPAWIIMTPATLTHPTDVSDAITRALITAIAGFIGAIRWVSAKSADYSSPMVATGVGALPPGLLFNLMRGFDVIALITLPVLVGWSIWISVAIALICYLVLRSGGIDTERMMRESEQAKKELELVRSGKQPPANKVRYTRSSR